MGYEQFTRCVEPSQYVPRSIALMVTTGALVAGVPLLLAWGHPACMALAAVIGFLASVIAYCRNFLYERLICLGGDRDVIGAVARIFPPPGAFALDWDDDYSINLLLENTPFGVEQVAAEESMPFGYLIKPQDSINALKPKVPGYDNNGYVVQDKHHPEVRSATLHAEFEGGGNYNMMKVSEGMLGVAIVAFLICLATPFPIDWIVFGFVALGVLLGLIISKFARPGSPSDANPSLPVLHENDKDGLNADVVYVMGTWVYDPLHQGWNEIHPIKVCTFVRKWGGSWPTQPGLILRLRHAFDVARAEETIANQARPQHQWHVHPDLDGCAPDIIL